MKARGLALVELVIVIGLIMALGAGVAALAWHVEDTEHIDRAAKELHSLLQAIDASTGNSIGHTSGLTAERLADEELAPPRMIHGGALSTRWGPVLVEPLTLDPRRPHAHVRVIYQGIPSEQCPALAAAFRPAANALRVNGQSVLDGVELDRQALTAACSQSSQASIAIDHDTGGGGDASLL
jgi:hypothetical protein